MSFLFNVEVLSWRWGRYVS